VEKEISMAEIIFLGTASAVAFEGHENTYLVIQGKRSSILVDCAANPLLRLKEAGVVSDQVGDLIITHFHADHVGGLANFLMDLWILGRKAELLVYGNEHAITRTRKLLDLFDWSAWEGMYPVQFRIIPQEELVTVLENGEFRVQASPVEHVIPTLGLRITNLANGFAVAYSSDTNPVSQTVRLAQGADVLIHEATGPYHGHSTAAQAGEIASQSGVGSLFLIHYAIYGDRTSASILAEARTTFNGPVHLAEDFHRIKLDPT
jgi:ribonuclease Z